MALHDGSIVESYRLAQERMQAQKQTLNPAFGAPTLGQYVGKKTGSPFDELASSVEHLEKARAAVRGLADSLCGVTPEMATGSATDVAKSLSRGIFDDVADKAAILHGIASAIIAAVERIERRL